MSAGRTIKLITVPAGVALVALIVLAVGLEVEDQLDPVRMRERSVTTFFGLAVSHGHETQLDFALRFPDAVKDREAQSWWASGNRRRVFGRTYASSQSKRWAKDARLLVHIVDTFDIPSSVADPFAKRIIDLIAQRADFTLNYDDEDVSLRDANGALLETWSIAGGP